MATEWVIAKSPPVRIFETRGVVGVAFRLHLTWQYRQEKSRIIILNKAFTTAVHRGRQRFIVAL